MKFVILSVTILLLIGLHNTNASTAPNLRFASPLQSLTIWDEEVKEEFSTPRSRFLPKFKAGLAAEMETRKALKERNQQALLRLEEQGGDWAKKAAILERRQQRQADQLSEEAFDEAIKSFTSQQKAALQKDNPKRNPNKYQFVGVVNKESSSKPVTWYARKKPASAKWSLRLVHVNRDAIIKDLFNRGKVDIFAKYRNTGETDEESNQRVIKTDYIVKERSWRTLWNFSPKHFFTDSSGAYWRERRLPGGLYTDGNTVYESCYRYRDGRNGMRRIATYDQFMDSPAVDSQLKENAKKNVNKPAPDIVLEECVK
jgi:hypothetical protein